MTAGSSRQPHDMGGLEAGPIDTVDHGMAFWERQTNALRGVVVRTGIATLDEMRRATEDLGARYHELSYWEKATVALRTVLVERGIVDDAQVETRMKEIRARYTAAQEAAGGDRGQH
jgi:hypothetical protein